MGVFLVKSRTPTNSQPSVDGWVIVSDPSGTTTYNFYQKTGITGGDSWTWTLQAPSIPGTYYLYAREHHGKDTGVPHWQDDAVGLTFTVSAPPDTTPPAAIADLAVTNPTPNSVTLTWTATGDNGNSGTADGYQVKYSTTGEITSGNWDAAMTFTQSWSPKSTGNPESQDVTGLSPETQYWFALKVFDEVPNYSGVSNSPTGTTLTPSDTTAPSAITDLAASAPTTSSVTLKWTAPGDDGTTGTAAGYVVKYSSTGAITTGNWDSATTYMQSWTPSAATTQESHDVDGLDPDTEYWFAIRAFDEVPNNGDVSNSPSISTLVPADTTPPSAITDLAAINPTTDSITLTWTAPGDDGTTGTAAGYDVRYSTSGEITEGNWDSTTVFTQSWTPLASGSSESHVVDGLTDNTKYWFAVKAFDEGPNRGDVSNSPSATTVTLADTTPPSTITDLVVSMPTTESATLTFTAPGDDGDVGTAAGYVIKCSDQGEITDANWDSISAIDGTWIPQAPGSSESIEIYNMSSNTTYWFGIKAFDEVPNYSNVSNSPSITTLPPPDTTAPVITSGPEVVEVTNTTATIVWTTDELSEGSVEFGNTTSYGFLTVKSAPLTSHNITLTDLVPGTTYYCRISSSDANGNGPTISAGFTFTTVSDDTGPDDKKDDDKDETPGFEVVLLVVGIGIMALLSIVGRKRKK
jgi:phosphodiesterase/alkaline phosphatase D-like protein